MLQVKLLKEQVMAKELALSHIEALQEAAHEAAAEHAALCTEVENKAAHIQALQNEVHGRCNVREPDNRACGHATGMRAIITHYAVIYLVYHGCRSRSTLQIWRLCAKTWWQGWRCSAKICWLTSRLPSIRYHRFALPIFAPPVGSLAAEGIEVL